MEKEAPSLYRELSCLVHLLMLLRKKSFINRRALMLMPFSFLFFTCFHFFFLFFSLFHLYFPFFLSSIIGIVSPKRAMQHPYFHVRRRPRPTLTFDLIHGQDFLFSFNILHIYEFSTLERLQKVVSFFFQL